jgi:hypothetical protein
VSALPLGRSHEMNQFEALTLESEIANARATMATWYRFFVGKVPPENVPDIIHFPDADIAIIAEYILNSWRTQA